MDKVLKFLKKIPKKDFETYSALIEQIIDDYTKVPDLKKLSGSKDLYRARFGNYRIIFRVKSGQFHEIVRLSKRDEKTYKKL